MKIKTLNSFNMSYFNILYYNITYEYKKIIVYIYERQRTLEIMEYAPT